MILRIVITILVYGFLGWLLCDINPNETYYWYSGIWHGLFFFVNWVRHFFWDCEFKAEHFTTAYNVFYWIFSIMSTLGVVFGGTKRD